MWNYHAGKAHSVFDNIKQFTTGVDNRYGTTTGAADYSRKSELQNSLPAVEQKCRSRRSLRSTTKEEPRVLGDEASEGGSNTVRYVSGLGALPSWIRELDGYGVEAAAGVVFLLTMLWIFWLW